MYSLTGVLRCCFLIFRMTEPSGCSTSLSILYNIPFFEKNLRLLPVALRLLLCRFACEADIPANCLRIDKGFHRSIIESNINVRRRKRRDLAFSEAKMRNAFTDHAVTPKASLFYQISGTDFQWEKSK